MIQISSVDVPSQYGRLRDIDHCYPKAIGNDNIDEVVEGESLVLVTSSGYVLVLSFKAVETSLPFEHTCQSIFSVKVEPRLTCVVAWVDHCLDIEKSQVCETKSRVTPLTVG